MPADEPTEMPIGTPVQVIYPDSPYDGCKGKVIGPTGGGAAAPLVLRSQEDYAALPAAASILIRIVRGQPSTVACETRWYAGTEGQLPRVEFVWSQTSAGTVAASVAYDTLWGLFRDLNAGVIASVFCPTRYSLEVHLRF